MVRAMWSGVAAAGLLVGGAVRADTALVFMTPETLAERKFRVTSKVEKAQVEFVVRRDIRGIDGPGRSAFVWNSKRERKGLGTPVKREEDPDKTLTYRFSVPRAEVGDTVFTLWGQGIRGEGITYEFKLKDFWKP